MLTDEIALYIQDLKSTFPSITAVWLIGSRGNGNATEVSDWDFLVFSYLDIHDRIKKAKRFHRKDIDLLLVGNDGVFTKPFGEPKGGSLQIWKWEQVTDILAKYEGCKWIDDEDGETDGGLITGRGGCKTLNAHLV